MILDLKQSACMCARIQRVSKSLNLSMPFRVFLDTMTKWSSAATFIFQLWPGASDTLANRGK